MTSGAPNETVPPGQALLEGVPRPFADGPETSERLALRSHLTSACLVAWDALAVVLVAIAGSAPLQPSSEALPGLGWTTFAIAAATPLLLAMVGVYGDGTVPRDWEPLRLLGRLALAAALAYLAAGLVIGLGGWHQPQHLAFEMALLPAAWLAPRWVLSRRRRAQRVVIVGSGAVADHVVALYRRHTNRRLEAIGYLDDQERPVAGDLPRLGELGEIRPVIARERPDRVLVCFSSSRDAALVRVLRECDEHSVPIDVVPRLYELLGPSVRPSTLGGLPLLAIRGVSVTRRGPAAAKRAFDVAVAGVALVCLLPVMLAIAAAIAASEGRPILFRQERVGRDLRPFRIVKFRTMASGAERRSDRLVAETDSTASFEAVVAGVKRQAEEVTGLPGFLRRTSLDELPQLWNVLRGDMSLVGPRPLRPYEVATLSDWQLVRQRVRPGITGLWQVLGRSQIGWSERLQLDYAYVRHWRFVDDVRILLDTVRAVASRAGAV